MARCSIYKDHLQDYFLKSTTSMEKFANMSAVQTLTRSLKKNEIRPTVIKHALDNQDLRKFLSPKLIMYMVSVSSASAASLVKAQEASAASASAAKAA